MSKWFFKYGTFSTLVFLSLVTFLTASARAVHISQSLSDRTEKADYIVLGTVIEQQVASTRVKRIPMIYTTVRLRVEKHLKVPSGQSGSAELLIQVPGGQLGDRKMFIPESPQFRDGERVLMLLRWSEGGICQLVNGHLGKYAITEDPRTGEELVSDAFGQPLGSEELAALGLSHLSGDAIPAALFLDELEELIHGAHDQAQ